jgi:hypothetical protein
MVHDASNAALHDVAGPNTDIPIEGWRRANIVLRKDEGKCVVCHLTADLKRAIRFTGVFNGR